MNVPLALAYPTGLLRSGNKTHLADKLTHNVIIQENINLNENVAYLIIDGPALMQSLGRPKDCTNFGDLADSFVSSVLNSGRSCHRIDILFDRYRDLSIKSSTRDKRNKKSCRPVRRVIEDRNVPLPNDWSNFMALSDNKADYARFLSEELILQAPEGKEIVASGGFVDELDVCSSKAISNLNHLKSNHKEAGTRIILHAVNYNCHMLIVSCRDTDVLVLLVSHFHKMQSNKLWVKTGTSKNQKCIPVHEIVSHIS